MTADYLKKFASIRAGILDVCARCFLISILCPPPVTPIKFGCGISSHSLSMHSKIDIQSAFSICPFPKYCQTSHFRSKYSKDHLLKRSNIKWREINRKKINKKKDQMRLPPQVELFRTLWFLKILIFPHFWWIRAEEKFKCRKHSDLMLEVTPNISTERRIGWIGFRIEDVSLVPSLLYPGRKRKRDK